MGQCLLRANGEAAGGRRGWWHLGVRYGVILEELSPGFHDLLVRESHLVLFAAGTRLLEDHAPDPVYLMSVFVPAVVDRTLGIEGEHNGQPTGSGVHHLGQGKIQKL
jgi:hypothetical protein